MFDNVFKLLLLLLLKAWDKNVQLRHFTFELPQIGSKNTFFYGSELLFTQSFILHYLSSEVFESLILHLIFFSDFLLSYYCLDLLPFQSLLIMFTLYQFQRGFLHFC